MINLTFFTIQYFFTTIFMQAQDLHLIQLDVNCKFFCKDFKSIREVGKTALFIILVDAFCPNLQFTVYYIVPLLRTHNLSESGKYIEKSNLKQPCQLGKKIITILCEWLENKASSLSQKPLLQVYMIINAYLLFRLHSSGSSLQIPYFVVSVMKQHGSSSRYFTVNGWKTRPAISLKSPCFRFI